jgi:hypothetical protein
MMTTTICLSRAATAAALAASAFGVSATAGGAPAGAAPAGAGAANTCVPAPLHRGAPPRWTAPAWANSSPGLRIPYALASNRAAAAFFFAPSLRAGHPTNPANKVLWVVRYPRDGSPLRILAHSGGAGRPETTRLSFPDNSSPGEIYPSYVDLPTPGCWALTLRWSTHTATIDVQVRAPARAQAGRA